MSEVANSVLHVGAMETADEICRDERCQLLGLHIRGPRCIKTRGREALFSTRSRRHATQPWRAYSYDALHESVFGAVSSTEPRTFAMILAYVENDYGSCCERSVHRHLAVWRQSGEIVRLDFKSRIHAYLRAGSRLIKDPDLVFEQILDVHAEAMLWAENHPAWKRRNGGTSDAAREGADWCARESTRLAEGTNVGTEPAALDAA